MKVSTAVLSVGTLSLAMMSPAFGQNPASTQSGSAEAQHMVPARASLTHALDSKDVHAGDQFRVKLDQTVHLNGGAELRRGDALVGNIVQDDTNTPGSSRLAVRFTQAVTKSGQTIPIRATIVALSSSTESADNADLQPDHTPASWNNGTLRVDQEDVVGGVDLHSRVSSANSGVFVSTTKNNFKIPAGSEITLAIAPSSGSTNASVGD